MHRSISFRGRAGRGIAALVGLAVIAGCTETPSTSSTDEKALIKGVVNFQGKPVKKGTITFDPSNVNRRMASAVTEPIKEDGSYAVTTLVGRNTVSFNLPGLGTAKNKLNYSQVNYEVKSGENSFNIDLPLP